MPASSSCNERAQHGFVNAVIVPMEQVQFPDDQPTYEQLLAQNHAQVAQIRAQADQNRALVARIAELEEELAALRPSTK